MPEHTPGVLPKALLASLPQPSKYRRYFYIMTFSLMFISLSRYRGHRRTVHVLSESLACAVVQCACVCVRVIANAVSLSLTSRQQLPLLVYMSEDLTNVTFQCGAFIKQLNC